MRLLPAVAALFGAALALPAVEPVLIRNVRVFDGSRTVASTSVQIADGRISRVGQELRAWRGTRVIDGRGKTLLPGLIDAHMHLRTTADLDEAFRFGVTTSLDMFTRIEVAAAARATGRGDLFSAGTPATTPGGHGTEYGVAIPTLSRAAEAEVFVEARLAEGSDYLKIMKDDGSAFGFHRPTLDAETMRALIGAAHSHRRLAIVHIATAADAREALAAGADGIAHVPSGAPDAELVRAAVRRGAFWTPTLAVFGQDSALAMVRALHDAGIRVLAGTDAPNPGTTYGETLHKEMELLIAAGLSPAEALASASSVPASAFGLADRGRIAIGLRADLMLVDGDPSVDIHAARKIVALWKHCEQTAK